MQTSAMSPSPPTPRSSTTGDERLVDVFNRYFEVIYADSDELRDLVFRIRYQVYCIETHFEDPADYPEALERDAYDDQALHVLLRHRATGWSAGTARLALVGEREQQFPVERACGEVFSEERLAGFVYERGRTAEVSRFAVSKEFRRRYKEFLSPTGIGPDDPNDASREGDRRTRDRESNVVPHIQLGLIRGLVGQSLRHDVRYWCAAMEPALLRRLARIGIHFHDSGKPVDYHGKRQPCIAELDELLAHVEQERRDVWEVLVLDQ